jgi:large subunit ribosomal protein L17
MIGLAKGGKADLCALRRAAAVITKRTVLDKLFSEAGDRFADRASGFTVMVKTGLRPGDAAPVVILELTSPGQTRASVGGQAKKPKGAGDRAKRVAQSSRKAEPAPAAAEEAGAEVESVEASPAVEPAEEAAAPAAEGETETAPAEEAESAAEKPAAE